MSLCGSERHRRTWPGLALHVVEREGRVFQQVDLTIDQDTFAGGALAFLAAMRQGDALAEGCIEDRLAFLDAELDVHRQKTDRVRVAHRAPVRCRRGEKGGGREAAPTGEGGQLQGLMVKPARYSARCCSRCSGVISRSSCQRRHERVAADIVQGPHLLVVEAQMRLRDQGLAVGADEVRDP